MRGPACAELYSLWMLAQLGTVAPLSEELTSVRHRSIDYYLSCLIPLNDRISSEGADCNMLILSRAHIRVSRCCFPLMFQSLTGRRSSGSCSHWTQRPAHSLLG